MDSTAHGANQAVGQSEVMGGQDSAGSRGCGSLVGLSCETGMIRDVQLDASETPKG